MSTANTGDLGYTVILVSSHIILHLKKGMNKQDRVQKQTLMSVNKS